MDPIHAPDTERPGPAPGAVLSKGRNSTKARVRCIDWSGRPAVEKDYSARPALVRLLLGPRLLDREQRALGLLAGMPGIPAALDRPSRQRLVMEWLDGRTLSACRQGANTVPAGFFDALDRLIESAHRRGVAQGDIGSSDVLVRSDGTPGLIDFSVSTVRRGRDGGWAFRAAAAQDLRRAARLRARYAPATLEERHRRLLDAETPLHRWARRFRRLLPGRRRR